MGNRSVNRRATAKAGSTSWKLKPDTARKTQGLIASHFGHLPAAMALFLALPMGAGGAWLLALRQVLEFTDATGSREDPSAAAIAFTYSGLLVMKLPTEALDSFSVPFREGMHQVDRQRRLRDDPALSTVVAGGPRWSGNLLEAGQPPTPLTVHVALLVYELDDERLDAVVRRVEGVLSAEKVKISHRVRLRIDIDDVTREHFGFADGISQPVPIGDAIVPPSGPDAATQLHWHGVKAGEILLGHENIHNERAPGPVLSADAAGNTKRLSKNGAPQGFLDLGLNGSYLGWIAALYPDSWLADPRFIIGLVLFVAGALLNLWADNRLIHLRRPGSADYVIPRGGPFEYLSCPNHLGEIVEWTGFAVMCWNLPALSFAIWTAANLIPRSLSHHRWYGEHFPDYPAGRRAVIPGFL